MRQPQHKDHKEGRKKSPCHARGEDCQSNCCLWPSRVISGAGAVECPTAPSEISLHVPCRGQCQADVSSGACRGFFYTTREGRLLLLLADKAKLERLITSPKSCSVFTRRLLVTCTWQEVREAKQPHSALHRVLVFAIWAWTPFPITFLGIFCSSFLHQPQWELPQCCISLGKTHFSEVSWAK